MIFQRSSRLSGNSATAFLALRATTSRGSSTSDVLEPEARASGLRTSLVLVPHDVAARRARNEVAEFPDNPEDLWKIKMRPEAGYLSVVSSSFNFVADLCFSPPHSLILTWLRYAGVEPQGLHLEASGPGGARSQLPARMGQ